MMTRPKVDPVVYEITRPATRADPHGVAAPGADDPGWSSDRVSDLEDVAERVTHHRSPIAIGRVEGRLHAHRASLQRLFVGSVRIFDVHLQEPRERLPLDGVGD
jgi:hypothetical protein